jgi:ADP-heptose:LPS heptosyltransferase
MSCAAVFQIGSLGDAIVSVPALRSLPELLPGCSEYILVSRFESEQKIMPNQIFDMAWQAKACVFYQGGGIWKTKILSVASALGRLRFYRPKYCVYMLPSERSQADIDRDARFFRLAGIQELIGFRALAPVQRQWGSLPQIYNTEAYLRLQRLWGPRAAEVFPKYSDMPVLQPDSEARAKVNQWLRTHRKFPGRQIVALSPYSNYPSRTLPEATIIELLKRLDADADLEVAVLGGKKDFADAQAAITASGQGINACGCFSPVESAALLKRCALAICSESGPMHLSGAVGTPTVSTFSRINSDLDQWLPLGRNHTILYQGNIDCDGCRLTHCTVKDHPCMRRFSAASIIAAVIAKLSPQMPVLADAPGMHTVRW